jgi:hypothetical protein
MPQSDIPAINFTISANARRGFEVLRQSFNAHSSDPAGVLCIGWGRFMPHSAPPFENVVVSFYGQSQRAEIAGAIQQVANLEIAFFATPKDCANFEGKMLDFDDDRGFYLRIE